MTARILDGKAVAVQLREVVRERAQAVRHARGFAPCLRIILAGDDESSHIYAKRLSSAGQKLGIEVRAETFPKAISQSDLERIVDESNADSGVDGIMVAMPLPKHLSTEIVSRCLDPDKDVDGITTINAGRLYLGHEAFLPSTAAAIIYILEVNQIPVAGQNAVVVGRSPVVGKPVAMMLLKANATVTIVHTKTADMAQHIREADIVIAAAGKAGLVRGSMLKPGCVVIDAGINAVDGGIVGDVAFDDAVEVASAITPVPGGVGPLTNVLLLGNAVTSAERRARSLSAS